MNEFPLAPPSTWRKPKAIVAFLDSWFKWGCWLCELVFAFEFDEKWLDNSSTFHSWIWIRFDKSKVEEEEEDEEEVELKVDEVSK